jgi:hypothetical protein
VIPVLPISICRFAERRKETHLACDALYHCFRLCFGIIVPPTTAEIAFEVVGIFVLVIDFLRLLVGRCDGAFRSSSSGRTIAFEMTFCP